MNRRLGRLLWQSKTIRLVGGGGGGVVVLLTPKTPTPTLSANFPPLNKPPNPLTLRSDIPGPLGRRTKEVDPDTPLSSGLPRPVSNPSTSSVVITPPPRTRQIILLHPWQGPVILLTTAPGIATLTPYPTLSLLKILPIALRQEVGTLLKVGPIAILRVPPNRFLVICASTSLRAPYITSPRLLEFDLPQARKIVRLRRTALRPIASPPTDRRTPLATAVVGGGSALGWVNVSKVVKFIGIRSVSPNWV